MIELKHNIR